MKAKIFNTALAVLTITLAAHSLCFARAAGVFVLDPTNTTVADPLTDLNAHIIKSASGSFTLIDATTKHVHLKARDIEILNNSTVGTENAVTPPTDGQDQDGQADVDTETDQKIKNYSKTYVADANTRLDIDNRYGKVSVKTWAKNEFKVDVQIKVLADKTDETSNLLNSINITDKKQGQTVIFKTIIDKEAAILAVGRNNFRKVEINYVVYMPAKNALNITNKLGNIELPDLNGKVVINCSFGDLVAKSLTNPANIIKVSYGDARIASLRASDLDITSGTLTLGWADKLNAAMSYSSAKIGKISTSGIINVKYGSGVQITDIDKNLKNLLVNSNYSAVKLGIADDENADFDVTLHYGSFNTGNKPVNISKRSTEDQRWNPTQNFKGHVGKGDLERMININSNYSVVKFE
ncbi:MAG: hypothetical protein ABI367_13935 [Mucilaginibacter sp.]